MSIYRHLFLAAITVALCCIVQAENLKKLRRHYSDSEMAVGAVASSSTYSGVMCPFSRPCTCFAGRISCEPEGSDTLTPLSSVSSATASKIMWYDLRITGLESIDHLPSPATLSVKNLHITGSLLTFVPVGILSELTGVIQLNLSKNRISRLRDNDFVGVPSLQQLDLGQNFLRIIDNNAFSTLSELRRLNLAMNSLLSVPSAVRSLRKLTHLDLHGNPIKVVWDYDFNHMGRLLKLDLSQLSPGLVIQKRAFCGLRSVRQMSDQIRLETGLTSLTLRNNNISRWDACSLHHLSHLMRLLDLQNSILLECPCNAPIIERFFRITVLGNRLNSCISRRKSDVKCANSTCNSYCSTPSYAESNIVISASLVKFGLLLSFIHRFILFIV